MMPSKLKRIEKRLDEKVLRGYIWIVYETHNASAFPEMKPHTHKRSRVILCVFHAIKEWPGSSREREREGWSDENWLNTTHWVGHKGVRCRAVCQRRRSGTLRGDTFSSPDCESSRERKLAFSQLAVAASLFIAKRSLFLITPFFLVILRHDILRILMCACHEWAEFYTRSLLKLE